MAALRTERHRGERVRRVASVGSERVDVTKASVGPVLSASTPIAPVRLDLPARVRVALGTGSRSTFGGVTGRRRRSFAWLVAVAWLAFVILGLANGYHGYYVVISMVLGIAVYAVAYPRSGRAPDQRATMARAPGMA